MEAGSKRQSKVSSTKAGKSLVPICVDSICANLTLSMISYPNYKYIFPIKALGMFAKKHGNIKIQ